MPFGKKIDGPAGRRRAAREEVALAGSAMSMRWSRPVIVTDVSARGAKLEGHEVGRLDPEVLLKVGDVGFFASIAWSQRGQCGITFDEPLTSRMIAHIKRKGDWATVMGLAA